MNWINQNKDWLFSGAGVAVLTILITFLLKKRKRAKSPQTDHSINQTMGKNIRAKGNVEFNGNKQNITTNKP